MLSSPVQAGGVHLPPGFINILWTLHQTRDPRLGSTIRAAHEAGWTYNVLGHAMKLTGHRAGQLSRKAKPEYGPVPGIPAVPVVPPSAPTPRPPARGLTSEEIDELRGLYYDYAARRDKIAEHWTRGAPKAHLAEVLGVSAKQIGYYLDSARWAAIRREEQRIARSIERRLVPLPKIPPNSERDKEISDKAKAKAFNEGRRAAAKLLQGRNLRKLEDWPGADQKWWVECTWCLRRWHTDSSNPVECRHRGKGSPNPPKRTKRTKPRVTPGSPPAGTSRR